MMWVFLLWAVALQDMGYHDPHQLSFIAFSPFYLLVLWLYILNSSGLTLFMSVHPLTSIEIQFRIWCLWVIIHVNTWGTKFFWGVNKYKAYFGISSDVMTPGKHGSHINSSWIKSSTWTLNLIQNSFIILVGITYYKNLFFLWKLFPEVNVTKRIS